MNRKFKDFSPRALLWLEVNLLESGGACRPRRELQGSRSGEQCSKSPAKAVGIGTVLKARTYFHFFFSAVIHLFIPWLHL